MRLTDQYLSYAAECVRVAREIKDPKDKATLLHMAEMWERLAKQGASRSKAKDDL
jgi:hypothetical protein